jgi:hypothetical protein
MPHYLILDPEVLKAAILYEGDTADEQGALESIPSDVRLPKVICVMDVERVAGMQRYVIDDDTDRVLSQEVLRVKRTSQPGGR